MNTPLEKGKTPGVSALPNGLDGEESVERAERGRREVLYLSMALILILGIGVIVYAFNFELLNGLFKSDYFNNMVRISLALLILAFIGLVVGLSVGRQRNEIAVLRSRGATALQVVGIAALEGVLLGALGLAIGSPMGELIAQVIGKARSFLNFTADTELRVGVTIATLRFGVAAMGLALVAQVVVAGRQIRYAPRLAGVEVTVVLNLKEVERGAEGFAPS